MKTYLITGITGYIGSMLAQSLLESNEEIKIIALVRNVEKVSDIFSEEQRKNMVIIKADITDSQLTEKINNIVGTESIKEIDYIYHCAATTESAKMIKTPVEVADGILIGTLNMLKLAIGADVKSMIYVSSMEVYGNITEHTAERVTEEQLGEIDLFNTRSCYPMSKRMAELYCFLYFKEYNVPVKIVRLAQTFGKGVLSRDNRVYMQMARAVIEKRDIVLHTTGESYGNYCSIDDAILGINFILENGQSGEAYNLVNEDNTMQIRQMAELVAEKVAEGKIKVVYDIPQSNEYGYATNTALKLSGEKLEKLGFRPQKSLEEMYWDVLSEWSTR